MITPAEKNKLQVMIQAMSNHIRACDESRSNLVAMDASEMITWIRNLSATFDLEESTPQPLLKQGDTVSVFDWNTGCWVEGYMIQGFNFSGKAIIASPSGQVTRGVNTSYLKKS